MSVETDNVLSAIRRGEDSLPKLRAATGLDYAKLHPILHELEFEKRSIRRSETVDGFDRYAPMPSGRVDAFKGAHWKEETVHTIPPAALNRTKVAEAARELALLQRNAPYCVACRGLCVLHGTDRTGKIRWRCRACDLTFVGSGTVRDLNRIAPEKREAAISAFNEAKSVRVVAREVGISHQTALKIRQEEKIEAVCPCGQNAKHKGWCSYRFQQSPARQAAVEKMNMAHIDPHEEAEKKIAEMVERGCVPRAPLGPEEEAVIEEMRDVDDLPDETEPRERAIIEAAEEDVTDRALRNLGIDEPCCGCGYIASHRGRCRDGKPKRDHAMAPEKASGTTFGVNVQAEIRQIVESMAVGAETDNPRLRAALFARHPELKTHGSQRLLSTYISQSIARLAGKTLELVSKNKPYGAGRKADVYRRTEQKGHAQKSGENITETITSNGHKAGVADNSVSSETSKSATRTERTLDALLRVITEKESQITVLQDDIVALRRVADILQT